ncbi:hypothetical protein LX36DRAFT_406305 [Colletotrichum falcatum]|nr:hypothetical protein LX36DRAFT_406305 [Colletotrichum falcatum]
MWSRRGYWGLICVSSCSISSRGPSSPNLPAASPTWPVVKSTTCGPQPMSTGGVGSGSSRCRPSSGAQTARIHAICRVIHGSWSPYVQPGGTSSASSSTCPSLPMSGDRLGQPVRCAGPPRGPSTPPPPFSSFSLHDKIRKKKEKKKKKKQNPKVPRAEKPVCPCGE